MTADEFEVVERIIKAAWRRDAATLSILMVLLALAMKRSKRNRTTEQSSAVRLSGGGA